MSCFIEDKLLVCSYKHRPDEIGACFTSQSHPCVKLFSWCRSLSHLRWDLIFNSCEFNVFFSKVCACIVFLSFKQQKCNDPNTEPWGTSYFFVFVYLNEATNSCNHEKFFCWSQEELLLDPSNTFPSQWRFSWIAKACLFERKMRTAETRVAPCEGELLDQCSSLGNLWQ